LMKKNKQLPALILGSDGSFLPSCSLGVGSIFKRHCGRALPAIDPKPPGVIQDHHRKPSRLPTTGLEPRLSGVDRGWGKDQQGTHVTRATASQAAAEPGADEHTP